MPLRPDDLLAHWAPEAPVRALLWAVLSAAPGGPAIRAMGGVKAVRTMAPPEVPAELSTDPIAQAALQLGAALDRGPGLRSGAAGPRMALALWEAHQRGDGGMAELETDQASDAVLRVLGIAALAALLFEGPPTQQLRQLLGTLSGRALLAWTAAVEVGLAGASETDPLSSAPVSDRADVHGDDARDAVGASSSADIADQARALLPHLLPVIDHAACDAGDRAEAVAQKVQAALGPTPEGGADALAEEAERWPIYAALGLAMVCETRGAALAAARAEALAGFAAALAQAQGDHDALAAELAAAETEHSQTEARMIEILERLGPLRVERNAAKAALPELEEQAQTSNEALNALKPTGTRASAAEARAISGRRSAEAELGQHRSKLAAAEAALQAHAEACARQQQAAADLLDEAAELRALAQAGVAGVDPLVALCSEALDELRTGIAEHDALVAAAEAELSEAKAAQPGGGPGPGTRRAQLDQAVQAIAQRVQALVEERTARTAEIAAAEGRLKEIQGLLGANRKTAAQHGRALKADKAERDALHQRRTELETEIAELRAREEAALEDAQAAAAAQALAAARQALDARLAPKQAELAALCADLDQAEADHAAAQTRMVETQSAAREARARARAKSTTLGRAERRAQAAHQALDTAQAALVHTEAQVLATAPAPLLPPEEQARLDQRRQALAVATQRLEAAELVLADLREHRDSLQAKAGALEAAVAEIRKERLARLFPTNAPIQPGDEFEITDAEITGAIAAQDTAPGDPPPASAPTPFSGPTLEPFPDEFDITEDGSEADLDAPPGHAEGEETTEEPGPAKVADVLARIQAGAASRRAAPRHVAPPPPASVRRSAQPRVPTRPPTHPHPFPMAPPISPELAAAKTQVLAKPPPSPTPAPDPALFDAKTRILDRAALLAQLEEPDPSNPDITDPEVLAHPPEDGDKTMVLSAAEMEDEAAELFED